MRISLSHFYFFIVFLLLCSTKSRATETPVFQMVAKNHVLLFKNGTVSHFLKKISFSGKNLITKTSSPALILNTKEYRLNTYFLPIKPLYRY